jgi:TusE/DsrC/DsvC family sulfur relay protein
MQDINSIIDPKYSPPEGGLLGLEDWSEQIAQELAAEEGITLSKEHWIVIHFLRDHYQRCGPCSNGRAVLHLLEDNFSQLGDKKHLYHLFPRGPVVQAYKIAGLPLPPYSTDASFGSVM